MALPINAFDVIKDYFTSNNILASDETIQGLIDVLQTQDLFVLVKNYLDITWADEQTDLKVRGIMARGKKYLNGLAGTELDYSIDDNPQSLLLDYCRYARNNVLEYFSVNFSDDILSLSLKYGAEALAIELEGDTSA